MTAAAPEAARFQAQTEGPASHGEVKLRASPSSRRPRPRLWVVRPLPRLFLIPYGGEGKWGKSPSEPQLLS
jgi:hypothetical protein